MRGFWGEVLAKTPGLYLVPELRYPCHCCHPCCCCRPCRCRRPCRCPPPHCLPPRRHHHEADALGVLDVLAKTPCLYLVPELRYPCHSCRRPHHRHHHHHLGSWGNTRGRSSRKPQVSIKS